MTDGSSERRAARAAWWFLGVVAVAYALLRLVKLDADPSSLLESDFITDEGWWAQNARDHALFGRWVTGQHNPALLLCPAHTIALRAAYGVSGVSFWSTRVVGAIASLLTVLLVGWMLRRTPRAAVLAAALVATQPILFSMSRVAFPESLQLLFVTLAVAAAADPERKPASWIIAGGAAALAVLTKASALYAPILVLLAPFLTAPREALRRSLREMGLVATGGILMAIPFIAFEWQFLDLLRNETAMEGTAIGFPPRGAYLLFYLGLTAAARVYNGFWPGVFALLALAGVLASRALVTRPTERRSDAVVTLSLAWLAFSFSFLALRGLPPLAERYWMNMLVPIACLVALGCGPRQSRSSPAHWSVQWIAAATLAVAPLMVLRSGALLAVHAFTPDAIYPLRSVLVITVLMGIGLTATLHLLRVPQLVASLSVPWQGFGAAVVLLSAYVSTSTIVHARYSVRDASRALVVGSGSRVLVGDPANTLSLETPYFAFLRRNLAGMNMGTGWLNEDWKAFGATHWLEYGPPEAPPPPPPVPGAILRNRFPLWPDNSGRERTIVFLFELPATGR